MSNNMTPQQAHKILNEYLSLDSDLDNKSINALRVADTVEIISKADYKNRLKADMVTLLTEIQIEFDEKYWRDTQGYIIRRNGFNSGIEICIDIIQEKINALKAEWR